MYRTVNKWTSVWFEKQHMEIGNVKQFRSTYQQQGPFGKGLKETLEWEVERKNGVFLHFWGVGPELFVWPTRQQPLGRSGDPRQTTEHPMKQKHWDTKKEHLRFRGRLKDKERERDTDRSGLMDCSERSKMALHLETTERIARTANNRKTVLANRKLASNT